MKLTWVSVSAGLRREDAVVDLATPARPAREDPKALQLLLAGKLRRRLGVEDLGRRHPVLVVRDPVRLAEDEDRGVFFWLDLDLRGKAL